MNQASSDALTNLKAEWDGLQPLSSANKERLWKKFRLEWNYHSNHIEGNTLTYGETELLLIFGDTKGNHTWREYEEMKAHDVAIAHVREMANETRGLVEKDIRDFNKLILKESFWKEATTREGEATRIEIIPGQYKTQPNKVKTATGDTFSFADPLDVPSRIQDYLKIVNQGITSAEILLVQLAKIHHEFLLIHPFDDGNGRVARLLLNYVLMKNGYPPIIIRTEQKKEYLAALRRADATERDYSELQKLLEKNLTWSLETGIRAAKGESIEEPWDIEKEIALFAKEQAGEPDKSKTRGIVLDLWQKSLGLLFDKFVEKMDRFRPLFAKIEFTSSMGQLGKAYIERVLSTQEITYIFYNVNCERYCGKSAKHFDYNTSLRADFQKYEYTVMAMNKVVFKANYSRLLAPSEADKIIEESLKLIFADIQKQAAQK